MDIVYPATRPAMQPPAHRKFSWLLAVMVGFAMAGSALAQKADHDHDHDHEGESLEQSKHEHGVVTFNLALEGELLSLEVDAPAINVLGFERSPRNDAERKVVADTHAWLSGGREILAVPGNAGCRAQAVSFTAPKLGSGHADYRPRYSFRCSNPAALGWVEVWALRKLKDVERAEVNLITPTVQRQQTLGGGELRVSLK